MTRIAPLPPEQLPSDVQQGLAFAEQLMGFKPNDVLVMARWPALLTAMKQLVDVVYAPGQVDAVLKRMVATVVSGAAGCRYCQAHTAHGAVKMLGADAQKIAAVWQYPSSPLFSDAERAALDLALAAGVQPNATTDLHFERLREHFSERQIVELMGVIGLFGFLNRWNDTLATTLEAAPLAYAQSAISPAHWTAGKHAPHGSGDQTS
jgi:uncharacterized peroxidase-related enzyme